jgi:hypothetical protein
VQVLRVDWPVYLRRADHNTIAEGGNRGWAELWGRAFHPDEPQNHVAVALARRAVVSGEGRKNHLLPAPQALRFSGFGRRGLARRRRQISRRVSRQPL